MPVARGSRATSERYPGNECFVFNRTRKGAMRLFDVHRALAGAWSLDICRECWRAEFPSLHHCKEGNPPFR